MMEDSAGSTWEKLAKGVRQLKVFFEKNARVILILLAVLDLAIFFRYDIRPTPWNGEDILLVIRLDRLTGDIELCTLQERRRFKCGPISQPK